MTKKCSKCGKDKPLEEFGNSKQSRDGKYSWCLECARANQRRSKERHRNDIRQEVETKVCTVCHEEKPANSFYRSRYSSDGRSSWCRACHCKSTKTYAGEHPEVGRKATERWRERYPDRFAYNKKQFGAKRRGLDWDIEREWYQKYIWNHPCVFCGGETLGGMDRLDNSRGYEKSNVVSCCPWCNVIKYVASLEELRDHLLEMLPRLDALITRFRQPSPTPGTSGQETTGRV